MQSEALVNLSHAGSMLELSHQQQCLPTCTVPLTGAHRANRTCYSEWFQLLLVRKRIPNNYTSGLDPHQTGEAIGA